MTTTRKCKYCGKAFRPSTSDQLYCSHDCKLRQIVKQVTGIVSPAPKKEPKSKAPAKAKAKPQPKPKTKPQAEIQPKVEAQPAAELQVKEDRDAELLQKISELRKQNIMLQATVHKLKAVQEANKETYRHAAELKQENTRLHAEMHVLRSLLDDAEETSAESLLVEVRRLRAELTSIKANALVVNVCVRMKLRQTAALPCGKRIECFDPDRCDRVPRGCSIEEIKIQERNRSRRRISEVCYHPSNSPDLI